MATIKTNYLAGKYELTKFVYTGWDSISRKWTQREDCTNTILSAAEAKILIKNKLYERLGFKSIEFKEAN